MYVSCGSGGESVWYNDLFYLDLRTLTWTKVEMEGKSPQPRDYLTLCSLSNLVSHQPAIATLFLLMMVHCVTCVVLLLQYLVMYGGFNELDGKEKCFSDVHYVDITAPSGNGNWEG